jgi:hypothetical protein
MPEAKPPAVEVAAEERDELERLVRRHTLKQQLAERARTLPVRSPGWWMSTSTLSGSGGRVGAVSARCRWLTYASRPSSPGWSALGEPTRSTPELVSRSMAQACEAPSASGRPISQWSMTEHDGAGGRDHAARRDGLTTTTAL